MKNNLLMLLRMGMLFSFWSCSYAGTNKKDTVSSIYNDSGTLVTKTPSDFDKKFGYELLVTKILGDSSKMIESKVFVSSQTWKKLPKPTDSIAIIIEYVRDIEYGENGGVTFWDQRFNLCVGYHIDTLIR
jgi:hypothetical protein